MIYTITFNPSVDYTVYTDSIVFGATNRSVHEGIHFGGKGVNVSRVLAELDVPSVALGFIAGFTGRALEDELTAQGIVTRFVHLPDGFTRINIKLHTEANTETEINGSGPDISPEALREFMAMLDELTADDTLVLAGSVPRSLPSDMYARILQRTSGKGVRCVVDATGELLVNALTYRPFLIKPNRQELSNIFGVEMRSHDDIVAYAKQLQDMGAENVLVSLGGEGAVLLDEQRCVHTAAAIPCRVVSTVGAGDSMLAGFLAGYDRTRKASEALALGTICGAATACSAGLAVKDKIEELSKHHHNKETGGTSL